MGPANDFTLCAASEMWLNWVVPHSFLHSDEGKSVENLSTAHLEPKTGF
jgi:hypothetical protein